MGRHDTADAPGRWFLRIHPLVWVAVGIAVLFLLSQVVGQGLVAWLDPIGLVGFWLLITALVVLFVVVLIRAKKRPEV